MMWKTIVAIVCISQPAIANEQIWRLDSVPASQALQKPAQAVQNLTTDGLIPLSEIIEGHTPVPFSGWFVAQPPISAPIENLPGTIARPAKQIQPEQPYAASVTTSPYAADFSSQPAQRSIRFYPFKK